MGASYNVVWEWEAMRSWGVEHGTGVAGPFADRGNAERAVVALMGRKPDEDKGEIRRVRIERAK